jgi:hypothetical protein
VTADSLAGRVGADFFGAWDPLGGIPKKLKVEYSFPGQDKITIDRDEHELLFLPESLHLNGLQEKTILLARSLTEMLHWVGPLPLGYIATSPEKVEANKRSVESFQIKLTSRYRTFEKKLSEIKERFEGEGISEQPLAQFRGIVTVEGIQELVRTLYKLAMQIDDWYPKELI